MEQKRPPLKLEILRLHRLGYKPAQIREMTGASETHISDILRRYAYGPTGHQAQIIQSIYEMMSEALVILRSLSKMKRKEIMKRIDEIQIEADARHHSSPAQKSSQSAISSATLLGIISGSDATSLNNTNNSSLENDSRGVAVNSERT